MASAGPGRSIRVLERDGFFDDAFFREAWDDFDRAMQSVLDRFDSTGLKVDVDSRSHCRDVYSKIRSSKIDEDLYASQALQITEKDGKFQVVMDVKDFNPRELQVRAVDDRIVVEGSYQKTSDDGASSSCKSFYKEFNLPPAADIDQVSTALSKDGVLTIKAPKKDGAAITDTPQRAANTSTSSSSSTMHQQFSDNSSATTSIKSTSTRKVIQSSSSFESSSDGFEALPKEMREKLMFCDSGFGSTKTSTCSSPAPSEAGSESSRVSSTMEFDLSKRHPVRTEVAFNVSKPSQGMPQQPQQGQAPQNPPNFQPHPQQMPPQMFQAMPQSMPQQFQQFSPQQHQQFQEFQQQYQQSPTTPAVSFSTTSATLPVSSTTVPTVPSTTVSIPVTTTTTTVSVTSAAIPATVTVPVTTTTIPVPSQSCSQLPERATRLASA
ncbi:mucin-2-like isoform X2 [Scylla paramamosain]